MSSNRQQKQQHQQHSPPDAVQANPCGPDDSMPATDYHRSSSTGTPTSQSLPLPPPLPPPFPPQTMSSPALPLLHRQYPNAQRQFLYTPNYLPQHLPAAPPSSSSSPSSLSAPAPAPAVAPPMRPPSAQLAQPGRPKQTAYPTYYVVTPAAAPSIPMPGATPVTAYQFPQGLEQENVPIPQTTHTNTNPNTHRGPGYFYPPQMHSHLPPPYPLPPVLPLHHAYSQPIHPHVRPPFQPRMAPVHLQLQRRPHSGPFIKSSSHSQMFQEQPPKANSFASPLVGPGAQQMPLQPQLMHRGGSSGEMPLPLQSTATGGRDGSRENKSSSVGSTGGSRMDDIRWAPKKTSKSWSKREDKLLLSLKEIDRLNWCQIANHFSDRTTNGCQFRWRRLMSKGKAGRGGKGPQHEEHEEPEEPEEPEEHGVDKNVKE